MLREQGSYPVLEHRAQLDKEHSLPEDAPERANLSRRRVGRRYKVCSQEMGQDLGIYAVVFDPGRCDASDLQWMGEQYFLAQIIEPIVHRPPTIALFEDSLERPVEACKGFFVTLARVVYTFSPEDHSSLSHDGNL